MRRVLRCSGDREVLLSLVAQYLTPFLTTLRASQLERGGHFVEALKIGFLREIREKWVNSYI